MAKIDTVKAEQKHIDEMKARMRASDMSDCAAISQTGPEAFEWSFKNSHPDLCWSVLADGKPIFAFGCCVNPKKPGVGVVWILGTDDLPLAKEGLISDHNFYIKKMLEHFEKIESVVDVKNEKAIRYAKGCGFVFTGPFTLGKNGEMFYYIYIVKGGV